MKIIFHKQSVFRVSHSTDHAFLEQVDQIIDCFDKKSVLKESSSRYPKFLKQGTTQDTITNQKSTLKVLNFAGT